MQVQTRKSELVILWVHLAFASHHFDPCLPKLPHVVERYMCLASRFRGCRMVELGSGLGTSTVFFTRLFSPATLMACEMTSHRSPGLSDLLSTYDIDGVVRLRRGTDLAQRSGLDATAGDCFGDDRLDLVVNVAGDELSSGTASFEALYSGAGQTSRVLPCPGPTTSRSRSGAGGFATQTSKPMASR